MSPSLNNPFDVLYDDYSIKSSKFSIPLTVDFYLPDNQEDFNCTGIIVPNPEKNAIKYTNFGKIITIGIYRDEGRETQEHPIYENVYWYRSGKRLILQVQRPHEFLLNDEVFLYNTNIPSLKTKILKIYNEFQFEVETFLIGDNEGYSGAYKPFKIKNFYEENIVFRLLPSFKLLKISEVNDLLNINSTPSKIIDVNSILNITTGVEEFLPNNKTDSVNYFYSSRNQPENLYFYHNQIFDELNNPLKIKYKVDGMPEEVNNVDSKYKNNKIYVNQSINLNTGIDEKVKIYDFYGYEINDDKRLPYYSNSLIYFDENLDIGYELNNLNKPKYNGKFLNDFYGNKVVKINQNNTTSVKKYILPLQLDRFNKPIKKPLESFIKYEFI